MTAIDPVFGKAEADEALISTALLLRTDNLKETEESNSAAGETRVWPGHCQYRGP
jgi:hypothetical protein